MYSLILAALMPSMLRCGQWCKAVPRYQLIDARHSVEKLTTIAHQYDLEESSRC
jgi:hypothetical protein